MSPGVIMVFSSISSASEYFDAGGRILQARIGAGGVDGDFLLDHRLRLEFHGDLPFARVLDGDRSGAREESFFRDFDFGLAQGDGRDGDTVAVCSQRYVVESDGCVRDGLRPNVP